MIKAILVFLGILDAAPKAQISKRRMTHAIHRNEFGAREWMGR